MSQDLRDIITLMINPNYQSRPSAKELLAHPIVVKFEKKRRRELQVRAVFYHIKTSLVNFWSKIWNYLNISALPIRNYFLNIFPKLKKSDTCTNVNSSPVNYNRTYVSNFLDQYSDDETNDIRLMSTSSFDSSISKEDEMFKDNFRFVF